MQWWPTTAGDRQARKVKAPRNWFCASNHRANAKTDTDTADHHSRKRRLAAHVPIHEEKTLLAEDLDEGDCESSRIFIFSTDNQSEMNCTLISNLGNAFVLLLSTMHAFIVLTACCRGKKKNG